jgi:hypothetical protein
MFEQTLEEMTATVWIDDKGAEVCRHNGVALVRGPLRLTYPDAVVVVDQMQALVPSVPKYQQARFRAVLGQICNAFGPEFWERHRHDPSK